MTHYRAGRHGASPLADPAVSTAVEVCRWTLFCAPLTVVALWWFGSPLHLTLLATGLGILACVAVAVVALLSPSHPGRPPAGPARARSRHRVH